VDHCCNWSAPQDGVAEGVDRQLSGHPVGDGVADDPVGPHILDGAEVELALTGRMLRDAEVHPGSVQT
jgi:hypothetical protein